MPNFFNVNKIIKKNNNLWFLIFYKFYVVIKKNYSSKIHNKQNIDKLSKNAKNVINMWAI